MKRVNYLNNRDILAEIHKSKNTFCSYTDDDFAQYDIILPSIDKINIRTIADAKRGDIGNTSMLYSKAFFEKYNFEINIKRFKIKVIKLAINIGVEEIL